LQEHICIFDCFFIFHYPTNLPTVRAEIEHNATGIFFLPASHILISLELDWMIVGGDESRPITHQAASKKMLDELGEEITSTCLERCCCLSTRYHGNRSSHPAQRRLTKVRRQSSLKRQRKPSNNNNSTVRPRVDGGDTPQAGERKEQPETTTSPATSQAASLTQRQAPRPPNGVPPVLQQPRRIKHSPTITAYEKHSIETEHGEHSILAKVCHHLSRKYTLLRRSGIERLLHNILDTVVKNYQPIPRAYTIELEFYQAVLQVQQAKFKKEHVENILRIKRELKQLKHQLLPVKSVMSSLVKSGNFNDDLSFFDSIQDALTQILFEIESCTEVAIELNESFIHYHDRRMNDVLYILTIVTTCVIPTQLFTGVFGMNFATTSNELGLQDPMLRWKYGYHFFWVFSVGTTLLGVLLFRWMIQ